MFLNFVHLTTCHIISIYGLNVTAFQFISQNKYFSTIIYFDEANIFVLTHFEYIPFKIFYWKTQILGKSDFLI